MIEIITYDQLLLLFLISMPFCFFCGCVMCRIYYSDLITLGYKMEQLKKKNIEVS